MNINLPYSSYNPGMQYPAVLKVTFSNESAIEPVTVKEAKAWCKVEGEDSDSEISDLIKSSREICEGYVNLSFISRTVTAKLKAGTSLPYGPAEPADITAITDTDLTDIDGDFEDLTTGTYIVSYPVTPDPRHAYKFKQALKAQILWSFEHRGDEDEGQLSPGAKAILKPYRIV